MVVLVEKPTVAPGPNGSAEIAPEPSRDQSTLDGMSCPRCEARLRISYEEPECLQCGYVDYQYSPPQSMRRERSVISTGTHYILRYVGEFPTLANTLTHIKLQRLRNRAIYGVDCPFCGRDMVQSSLSGKRREVREERYKCTEGHRVSLTPNKNGSLGWK